MSVSNGQAGDATTFNNAFMSRTTDTSTTGVVSLNHPSSGGTIANVQQKVNDNTSAISTHGSTTTGVHGVSGDVVGTTDAQTISGKSMSGATNTFTNIPLSTAVTGTLPIGNGGTGQTTANAALNALLPSQTSNANKFLMSDGSNANWSAASADINGQTEETALDEDSDTLLVYDSSAGANRKAKIRALKVATPIRKNAVINGAMEIWQANSGTLTAASTGTFLADTFIYYKSSAAVHTISKSSTVPTVASAGRLFNSSMSVACTTADTSIAVGDYNVIDCLIEGYTWQAFAQRALTLSFWVRSSKTGTHCAVLRNSGQDRSYVAEYTISAANTWEKKTINIPASPSAGTWNYTNGVGARLSFPLMMGSSYQTTAGAWQTGNYLGTANVVNECDSTSNTFYITGIQLECGNVATEFEHQTPEALLMQCQRQYETSYDLGSPPGTVVTYGGYFARPPTSEINIAGVFKVPKRGWPTMTAYSPVTGASGKMRQYDGTSAPQDINATFTADNSGFRATGTVGAANAFTAMHWVADARLS